MTKLYTRTGDGGHTSLLGGDRVGKDDARVEAYGSVDETNVALGASLVEVREGLERGPDRDFLVGILETCQEALMRLASQLATPSGEADVGVDDGDVEALEQSIDEAQGRVEETRNFLLPGVSRAEAALHVARATCRRAERRAVALGRSSPVPEAAVRFLNRLSDLLFALARVCLAAQGLEERAWRRS